MALEDMPAKLMTHTCIHFGAVYHISASTPRSVHVVERAFMLGHSIRIALLLAERKDINVSAGIRLTTAQEQQHSYHYA